MFICFQVWETQYHARRWRKTNRFSWLHVHLYVIAVGDLGHDEDTPASLNCASRCTIDTCCQPVHRAVFHFCTDDGPTNYINNNNNNNNTPSESLLNTSAVWCNRVTPPLYIDRYPSSVLMT